MHWLDICMYCRVITITSPVNSRHRTQVYSILFLVMRTLKSHLPSYFQIYNTVFLTVASILYITPSGFIHSITGNLCLLLPSPILLTPSLRQPPIYSLYPWTQFFVHLLFVVVLDLTYKWDHTVSIFFWLISFSIMPLSSIHGVTHSRLPLFFMVD